MEWHHVRADLRKYYTWMRAERTRMIPSPGDAAALPPRESLPADPRLVTPSQMGIIAARQGLTYIEPIRRKNDGPRVG
jgi:hypothetical protein